MRAAFAVLIAATAFVRPAAAQSSGDLIPGAPPKEMRIAGGETHAFTVPAPPHTFLRVRVKQNDTNVIVRIVGPQGATLVEANNANAFDVEFVSVVTPGAGTYRIEVTPGTKDFPSGTYEITLLAARPASPIDEGHARADAEFTTANDLRRKADPVSVREAMKIWTAAKDRYIAAGDDLRTAETWNRIGIVQLNIEDSRGALEAFEAALAILERVGDRRWQGVMLNNIGLARWNLAYGPEALQHYERALAIRREVGDRSGEASTLYNMALIYNALGDPARAIALHEETLPLRRAIRDGVGEARSLFSMAQAQRDSGHFQSALDNFDRARFLAKEAKDPVRELDVVRGQARAYLMLGDSDRARVALDEALALAAVVESKRSVASVKVLAGDLARSAGDQATALSFYNEALAIRREIGERPAEGNTLNVIGRSLLALGRIDEAVARQAEVLKIAEAVKDRDTVGDAHALMGEIALVQGRTDIALKEFEEELSIRMTTDDRINESNAQYGIARAKGRLGDISGALVAVRTAIDHLEALRIGVQNPDLRTTHRERAQKLFELQIELLMRQHDGDPSKGYDVAALEVSERARARGLLESVAGNLNRLREDADPKLIADRDDKLRRASNLEYRRTRALAGVAGLIAPTPAEITRAIGDFRDAEGRLLASSPRYAALLAPPDPDAAALRSAVGDALIVEYALGETRSFAWGISADRIRSYVLPGRAKIEEKVRVFYEALTARNATVADASVAARRARLAAKDRDAARLAADLGALVLAPLSAQLAAKTIVVVPDGALHLVPFELLMTKPGAPPLIAAHQVTVLPSATLLSTLRQKKAAADGARIAVIADPVFEPDDPRLASSTRSARVVSTSEALTRAASSAGFARFGRLQYSREEAAAITSLTTKGSAYEALDFAATRGAAISPDVSRARIVHFATHGIMNTNQPELSGLVLSLLDAEGRPQDGFFRLADIYNLRLDADLVVLSACRTGIGREIRGEGVAALARGFFAAGAPRVVSTLWDVDDRATAELMKRFYESMFVKKQSPAEALRSAQRAVSAVPRWSSPYYWAGFTLSGDWR